jgi:nucleoside-diphosphate-sugar epimerase
LNLGADTVQARVLVTGSNGFLGRHVVRQLRVAGHEVVPAERTHAPHTIYLDVCDLNSIEKAFAAERPSHVIHCAAYGVNYAHQDFDTAVAVNLHGSLALLSAAIRHGAVRFVQVGSCSEYGSKDHDIGEDEALMPTAAYGATKAAATLLTRQLAASSATALIIARPFGMWGPGEPSYRLVPQILHACRSQQPLDLTPCDVIRDYSYVADIAASLAKLAFATHSPGEIVNVASGRAVILKQLVLDIARRLGGAHLMHFGAIPHRKTEMHRLVADITRLKELIGPPQETPIEQGLREMECELVS